MQKNTGLPATIYKVLILPNNIVFNGTQQGVRRVTLRISGNSRSHEITLPVWDKETLQSRVPRKIPAVHKIQSRCDNTLKNPQNMKESSKAGRHQTSSPCTHCVMVRFDDIEWDNFLRMMEKADETVKAVFIKKFLFGKPFKVLVTDKSLAVYCAKLSEFFAQFRTLGVNYNLIVKELRTEFSEKKAMQYLYKLEKATIEMAKILAEVKALTVKFDEVWSQKSL